MSSRAHLESSSRAMASWYPSGDDRVVARVLGSTKMVLDTRDFSLTPHLVMDGFWESWITLWAMQQVTAHDRVLNIGANCGYYALLFARQGARVVAVEPQGELAKNITLSAHLNGWSDRIKVERCIAGEADREVTLHLHEHFAGSAYVGEPVAGFERQVTVRERVAATLMSDATCAFIDAEGYEPQIWSGLRSLLDKKQLQWIALEWAPSRYEAPVAFLASLRDYGTLTVVTGDGRERVATDQDLLRGTEWDTLVVRRR